MNIETIARIIGEGDMGPGISLRAALRAGMASYYPDNPRGAAGCVEWALRQAARRLTASGMEARQGGDVKQAPSRSDDGPPGRPQPIGEVGNDHE